MAGTAATGSPTENETAVLTTDALAHTDGTPAALAGADFALPGDKPAKEAPKPAASFLELVVPASREFTDAVRDIDSDPALKKFVDALLATADSKKLLGAKVHKQPTIDNSGPHTASDIRSDFRKLAAEKSSLKGGSAQTLKRHWALGMWNLFQYLEDGQKLEDPTYDWLWGVMFVGTIVGKDKRKSIKDKPYFQGDDYPIRQILVSLLDDMWSKVKDKPDLVFKCDNRFSPPDPPNTLRQNQDQHNFYSSVDLYLPGSPLPATGFWESKNAIALLQQVKASAETVGAYWNAYYNDAAVGRALNVSNLNVKFKGRSPRNWHGPGRDSSGLKLHIHLDAVPGRNTKDDF